MSDQARLLDDKAVRDFIINGYIKAQVMPDAFHQSIVRQSGRLSALDLRRPLDHIADLFEVFNHPVIRGVRVSLLGPNYGRHPRTHCHASSPTRSEDDRFPTKRPFHQDRGCAGHHRIRTVMAFYDPQDVNADMGPTAILPGSQYFNTHVAAYAQPGLPLCCKAARWPLCIKTCGMAEW